MHNSNVAQASNPSSSKIAWIVLTIVVTLAMAGALALSNKNSAYADAEGKPTEDSSTGQADSTGQDPLFIPANAADLDTGEFDKLKQRCTVKFDNSSIVPPGPNESADFVLKGHTVNAVDTLDEYGCYLFRNPTVGDMLIRGFITEKVPSGTTIGAINPWMQQFINDSSEDLTNWLEKDSAAKGLLVTEKYQRYAFNTWLLLNRLSNQEIQERTATLHYPLQALQISGLPHTYLNSTPYVGKFIVLSYTEKGRDCDFRQYGININDGRLAILDNPCAKAPEVVKKTVHVIKKQPKKPSEPKPKPVRRPSPTPKPTPTMPPPPAVDLKPKAPVESSFNNASTGTGIKEDKTELVNPKDMARPVGGTTANEANDDSPSTSAAASSQPKPSKPISTNPKAVVDPSGDAPVDGLVPLD